MAIRLPVSDGSDYEVRPEKIICLGLNYRDHIKESAQAEADRFKDETPTEPILFAKTPNTLIGPGRPIVLPAFLKSYGFRTCRTDYEAELAMIIGKGGKHIPEPEVNAHIFGYTCFNDVSQRNFQKHDKAGWFRGKSLDTFGPIGPRIVRAEDIGDPQALAITCRLNGKVVQDSNTSQMIFKIPAMVAFISRHFTLVPGDIIVTGTPSGVGPIAPGDVVEVEISGIGVLRNPVESGN